MNILLHERDWLRVVSEASIEIDILPGDGGGWKFVNTIERRQILMPSEELSCLIRERMSEDSATRVMIFVTRLPKAGVRYKVQTVSSQGGQWMKIALGLEAITGLTLSDINAAVSALTKQIHNTVTTRTENKDAERASLSAIRDRLRQLAVGLPVEKITEATTLLPGSTAKCEHGSTVQIVSIDAKVSGCPQCSAGEGN